MSDSTIVHLLRHGEVENPAGIVYGRLPGYHLSANGRAMASAAADYFADRPVVALFCSPLERAQETARPVAGRYVARPTGHTWSTRSGRPGASRIRTSRPGCSP